MISSQIPPSSIKHSEVQHQPKNIHAPPFEVQSFIHAPPFPPIFIMYMLSLQHIFTTIPHFQENLCLPFGGYGKHRSTIHLEASSHPSCVRFYIKPLNSISLPTSQAIWLPCLLVSHHTGTQPSNHYYILPQAVGPQVK